MQKISRQHVDIFVYTDADAVRINDADTVELVRYQLFPQHGHNVVFVDFRPADDGGERFKRIDVAFDAVPKRRRRFFRYFIHVRLQVFLFKIVQISDVQAAEKQRDANDDEEAYGNADSFFKAVFSIIYHNV